MQKEKPVRVFFFKKKTCDIIRLFFITPPPPHFDFFASRFCPKWYSGFFIVIIFLGNPKDLSEAALNLLTDLMDKSLTLASVGGGGGIMGNKK